MQASTKTLRLLCVAIMILPNCCGKALAQSKIFFTLPYGKWNVGFTSVELFDSTRAVPVTDSIGEKMIPGKPRPFQVSIWYPANAYPKSKQMKYRDYVSLFAKPLNFATKTVEGQSQSEKEFLTYDIYVRLTPVVKGWYQSRIAKLQQMGQREFDIATTAYLDAPHAKGLFPIIIYAPGAYGASFENDILMEYLASHGYIVVASPNWGPTGLTQIDREGLECQARDIEFLIGYGRNLPNASPGGVAIIGFSWGGLSNVVVAARNNSVAAIVTLDGSIRYFFSKDYVQDALVEKLPYTTPSIFIDQGANSNAEEIIRAGGDTGHAFYKSIFYADAYHITMKKIKHQNFVAFYNRFSDPQPFGFEADSSVFNPAFERISLYTLNFLNAYMKHDPTSKEFLRTDPTNHGIPLSDIVMERKYATRPLPNLASFASAIKQIGIEHASDFLRKIRTSNPGYSISEKELHDWGWKLKGDDAVSVFKLLVELHPKSPKAYNDLGDAYMSKGDTTNAIRSFEQSLLLDPNGKYAKDKLQLLKKN